MFARRHGVVARNLGPGCYPFPGMFCPLRWQPVAGGIFEGDAMKINRLPVDELARIALADRSVRAEHALGELYARTGRIRYSHTSINEQVERAVEQWTFRYEIPF